MHGDVPANTRNRLLRAAERILIEEGVTALTTRRVGEVSGLNSTLITYHFGTVAALLATLQEKNLAPMLEQWRRLDEPLPADADPLDELLQRWLSPLLAPACFNPRGRALVVIDEIAAHGERKAVAPLLRQMAGVADRVAEAIAPLAPQIEPAELRQRLRFISGAALGPPPRARLGARAADPAMGEEALAALTRFARASLTRA